MSRSRIGPDEEESTARGSSSLLNLRRAHSKGDMWSNPYRNDSQRASSMLKSFLEEPIPDSKRGMTLYLPYQENNRTSGQRNRSAMGISNSYMTHGATSSEQKLPSEP